MQFKPYRLNLRGISKADVLSKAFSDTCSLIEQQAFPSRDLELAKQKLEEAFFYAIKAMATDVKNQD